MQFATRSICNTCNFQHVQFATNAICNTCNLQHIQFATYAIYNMCNLQQLKLATCAICNMDQLDRPAGWINWTDQLDGPVLYNRKLGQFAYSMIDLSVCKLSQLLSPTKALFVPVLFCPYLKHSQVGRGPVP